MAVVGILALVLVCGASVFLTLISPQAGVTNPLAGLFTERKSDEVIVAELQARTARDDRVAAEAQDDIIREQYDGLVELVTARSRAHERETSVDVLAELAMQDVKREQENRHYLQFLGACVTIFVCGVWGYREYHKTQLELLEKARQ